MQVRWRSLPLPALGRAAGCGLLAAAIVAAAVQVDRDDAPTTVAPRPVASRADPWAPALTRCRTLGMAAETDTACEAAWAENRRRFFNATPAADGR